MVFCWSLSDNKGPQVSRTLLSIYNTVVCMVSTYSLISRFFSPLASPLVTVPNAAITIRLTVTFMFHNFFVLKQGLDTYLSFCFLSYPSKLEGKIESPLFGGFSLFLTTTRSVRLAKIRGSVCISKS